MTLLPPPLLPIDPKPESRSPNPVRNAYHLRQSLNAAFASRYMCKYRAHAKAWRMHDSSIKEGYIMMRAPQVSYGYVTVTFSNLRIAHDDVT